MILAILALWDDVSMWVIMLLYSWWEARNKTNAGEGVRSLGQVAHRATMLAIESNPARKEVNIALRPPDRRIRPPMGILKINCDGAFFAETKTGSWGFVIRDHNSHAVLAGSGSLGAVHDADCSEVQACLAALQAAPSHGIGSIVLESDSMNTVKALQSNERDRSPASVLYKEARELISLCFDSVQLGVSLEEPRAWGGWRRSSRPAGGGPCRLWAAEAHGDARVGGGEGEPRSRASDCVKSRREAAGVRDL
ncbi:hypothetical protein BDA96_10G328900 [Sorghum bicolor]|uniref:RNase H type-1 domain-containing protein n=1 Tax=Sorghum bicolor TaxID=4558 RepID=A0A921Q8U9_SORBI|nr:hypothetical protein BDA96_10G328900 [Sorghum bicolor]